MVRTHQSEQMPGEHWRAAVPGVNPAIVGPGGGEGELGEGGGLLGAMAVYQPGGTHTLIHTSHCILEGKAQTPRDLLLMALTVHKGPLAALITTAPPAGEGERGLQPWSRSSVGLQDPEHHHSWGKCLSFHCWLLFSEVTRRIWTGRKRKVILIHILFTEQPVLRLKSTV